MTPLWDTWAGVVIPMLLMEKHICTCLCLAVYQIKRQYYVLLQLISLSQTSTIREVPTACNLRLLVQWRPFPRAWWPINNFHIQTDPCFLILHKILLLMGLRKKNAASTLANSMSSYRSSTLSTSSTTEKWCSSQNMLILPTAGSPPIKGFTHVFQSLQLTAWPTHLNCHQFHFSLTDQ